VSFKLPECTPRRRLLLRILSNNQAFRKFKAGMLQRKMRKTDAERSQADLHCLAVNITKHRSMEVSVDRSMEVSGQVYRSKCGQV
jgi:hypothetical protein